MRRQTLKSVGLWVATILATLAFLGSGASKLAGAASQAEHFAHWGYPGWFLYVVGASELVGALLLIVPRTAVFGALVLGSVMVGAVGTHLSAGEGPLAIPALVLLSLVSLVGWTRRETFVRLFTFKVPHAANQTAR
jgi:uncharacterized membrane protein YphA (DoxX/SURF4 family)